MRKAFVAVSAALVLAAALTGCGGSQQPPMPREDDWHRPAQILLHYADKTGRLTRPDLEAGLRRDFAAADTNHNGVLDPDEVRAVNQARWTEDQSAISPLQDWNGDGVVDFSEFAATARALFNELDRDGNGVLTPDELIANRGGPANQNGDQQNKPRGGSGGRGSGGGGGPGGPGGGPPN
jgi:hypothetical protein